MHFSSDQASQMTDQRPVYLEPDAKPIPRVQYVKSLAKPSTGKHA